MRWLSYLRAIGLEDEQRDRPNPNSRQVNRLGMLPHAIYLMISTSWAYCASPASFTYVRKSFTLLPFAFECPVEYFFTSSLKIYASPTTSAAAILEGSVDNKKCQMLRPKIISLWLQTFSTTFEVAAAAGAVGNDRRIIQKN